MSTVVVPASLKKSFKSDKSGNLILPAGRLMYASLFTATRPSKSETNPKKFQYQATVLLPADVDLTALENEIKDLFESNTPEAKRATTKWRNPILKTADEGSLAIYAEDYPYMIRANSKQFQKDGKERPRPAVVDSQGQDVDESRDPEECYNGRWARLSLNPYWYPANDGIAGVSAGLVNAQLLWHDDPLAGGKAKASSDFEAVDDATLGDFE